MKTIQVTDEMYNSLMDISKELNTQNHRCTSMPYVIQVRTKEEVAAYEHCGEKFWFDDEGGKLEDSAAENEVIKQYLYDLHGDKSDDIYKELDEYEKEIILEDKLGCTKHEVTTKDKLTDFFFTDKGLRDKYGDKVNTYMTGISNKEMKIIMTFLCEISGGKLHT